jgi:hypothetical protein
MNIERSQPLYRGTQIVWYLVGILEALLAVRFLLKLMQANPVAGFSKFIYSLTGVFTTPFETVFRNFRAQGSIIEWTTLLAMIVYWFIAVAVIKLFVIGKPVSAPEADEKLGRQDR